MRESLRMLKAAAVVGSVWAIATGGFALLLVLFLAAFTRGLPSFEDMALLPAWFAAGGFLLGVFYSMALVLGVRDARLPKWKAALLGFTGGPALTTAIYLIGGVSFDASFLVGAVVLGVLVAALGVLTVSLTGVSEESMARGTNGSLQSPNPLEDMELGVRSASEPVRADF